MRGVLRLCWIAAAVALCLAGAAAAALSFPALSGRVVDDAHVLTPATTSKLTALLAEHERQTGNQVVIATLSSLQGTSIEQYGYQLGRAWGIGQKGRNNGALILVSPSTHDVRIEVGYGLEGTLTDAQSKLIVENVMLPFFRKGDYDGGVLNGTITTLQALGGHPSAAVSEPVASDETSGGNSGGGSGGLGIPIWLIVIVLWLVFGRFFWPLFFLGGLGGGRSWGGGGFGGGGFGGGGFGGGGFSGGGGSFGGGGASGHW